MRHLCRIFAFVNTLQEIAVDFRRRTTEDRELRARRMLEHLIGALQQAWMKAVEVNSSGGSATGITGELRRAERLIEIAVGFSKKNDYGKYLEFGVKPASGARYPAHRKPPPVGAIAKWLKRGRIPIPEKFQSRKSVKANQRRAKKNISQKFGSDAVSRFAWAISITIKRKGRPALKVFEKTVKRERENLRKILNQPI
jgi:hypothetical protein